MGAERTVCGWTVLAGMGWLLWIYAWVVSGVVLRTLATRGRKRAGPTSEAQWEGCSAAEGPKDNTAYDASILKNGETHWHGRAQREVCLGPFRRKAAD